jgi:hypothetical protein
MVDLIIMGEHISHFILFLYNINMFNKKTILATTIFTSVLACAVPAILTNNSTSVSTVARTSASNGTYTDSASEGNNDCTV